MSYRFRYRCCCGVSTAADVCTQYSDSFGSSDNTILSTNYTEVVGNWAYSTNTVSITGTSGAILTYGSPSTVVDEISVTVQALTANDVARIYFAGDSTGLRRDVCELIFGGTTGKVRILTGSSLDRECIQTLTTGVAYAVRFVRQNITGNTPVAIYIDGKAVLGAHCPTDGGIGGTYTALGTGNCAGTVRFDDLVLSQTRASTDASTCPPRPDCCYPVGNSTADWPTQIQIDIANLTTVAGGVGLCSGDNCLAFNGSWVLDFVNSSGNCALYVTTFAPMTCNTTGPVNTTSFNRLTFRASRTASFTTDNGHCQADAEFSNDGTAVFGYSPQATHFMGSTGMPCPSTAPFTMNFINSNSGCYGSSESWTITPIY